MLWMNPIGLNNQLKERISVLSWTTTFTYTRRSIRNLRFHQPVQAIAMKAVFGISVRKSLEVDEPRTTYAIMDEVKNKLDCSLGQYVRQVDLTYVQKQNIFRFFLFMTQKYFPDGTKDKIKARLVADGSQ